MYFVYCYYPNSYFNTTKYIIGIYETLEEARFRQKNYLLGAIESHDEKVINGICKRSGQYVITFLRNYPSGDQVTEVH